MKNFSYLKTFFSPFKRPKLQFYLGKTAVGVPYFYPRRWVKATPKMAHEEALRKIKKIKEFNERNKEYGHTQRVPKYAEVYEQVKHYHFPVDKRIGFDFVSLGWKTKWSATDVRFEWAPRWSFVCFGYQFAVTFVAPEQDHYWECWLYYELHTDKRKSKRERIAQCRKEFSCTWTSHKAGVETKTDYYEKILRKKYLK
ncbi:MAG TPA: hypothetical protein DEF82_02820 [Crocinitomicaceae bacterium]|nr:hypothetical protein [Crocinitomicaceae bacterium]